MPFQIGAGDIIAGLALILSTYSIKKTNDFNKKQNEFIETNDKLNKLLLEKEIQDANNKNRADISANFINIGTNKRRLKIFNKGIGTARNIRLEFPEGNDIFFENDLNRKFPIPILEQFQSVELIAAVHNQSPSRITIKLIWDDDQSINNSKELTPTVS